MSYFWPLSGDVDVVSHEFNHGFTSFHSDLIYSDESGGLNESFSDVAGTLADFFLDGDNGDWDIGADVFRAENQALRCMCDPTRDNYSIDHYEDYQAGHEVHSSSGIANKAFCLISQRFAETSDIAAATQATVRKAGEAWYKANAEFWTQSTTFQQGCQGTLDAAKALGFSESELNIMRDAWMEVGVYCDGRVEPLICDETITAESGEITSPNFPSEYPDNHKKTTCIIPASGSATTLHFTNFDTEAGYDFVVLKDGMGNVLSTTSGTTAPEDVTGTTIVVKFTSDGSVVRPGWRAVWGTGSSD
jgi:vibriolysin